MTLYKECKHCKVQLTVDNAAKKNKHSYRNECKKCRSNKVSKSFVGNSKRQAYMRNYIRKIGLVKEYPCEMCSKLCYKKYARAFCSDECRFMAYVDKKETCWLWTGTTNIKGYGKVCFKNNKTAIASRVSYELFKGPIINGMFICHTCDVPNCVAPHHLWAGTHMENMQDMMNKGRHYSQIKKDVKIKEISCHY